MTITNTSALQQSTELADVTRALYRAMSTWDSAETDRFISRQSGLVVIGTDPDEWVPSHDILNQMFMAQAHAMPGMAIIPSDLQAHAEGTVGWVADAPVARLPDGSELPMRMTAVFHQEEGTWKMVQGHFSVGVRNEEVLGEDLTQAFDQQLTAESTE